MGGGEHERDVDGSPDVADDPPTERALPEPEPDGDDYLRPHLPRDVFGSQIGRRPKTAGADEVPGAQDTEPPTFPGPGSSRTRTADLPPADSKVQQEIEQAIGQLQSSPTDEVVARAAPLHRAPTISREDEEGPEWDEWKPGPGHEEDASEAETTPAMHAQPRTTDYLVLHPFPLRTAFCLLNFALVMVSPWLAANLLNENVYYPALDVVAEVWFAWFGIVPAGLAVLLAVTLIVRRRKYLRYELGYVLVALLAAAAGVLALVVATYEPPSMRGWYMLVTWGALVSLWPLQTSLHINMDPAWVVGRRRYWLGAAAGLAPTVVVVGLLAGAVSAVHGAHGQWRAFIDPPDQSFCDSLFDPDGRRPGSLAMAVLGRRRDSRLPSRAATCVQALVTASWSGPVNRPGIPLTKAAVQASSEQLALPWADNEKNRQLADEWARRREQLEILAGFVNGLPASIELAFRERLRAKGPNRVECENPFRASEATLWRVAGHPDCGVDLDRVDRIKQAITWLSFLGTRDAFTDPMMNDLRSEEARDFRKLLQEVSHTSDDRETRTHDVTLVAPEEGELDRHMIVRVSPEEEEEGGQKLYLVVYVNGSLGWQVFNLIRDEWGTGSRLRCTLRSEYRRLSPRGLYRIFALKNRDDGYLIVRKWTRFRDKDRREYYQFILSDNPC